MKKNNTLLSWKLLFALIFFLAAVCLSGCNRLNTKKLINRETSCGSYTEAALSALEGYEAEKSEKMDSFFSLLSGENALICNDIQALSAEKQNIEGYWYPQHLVTVVLAVNKNSSIRTWSDIKSSNIKLCWNPNDESTEIMYFSALSYGLEGSNYTGKEAESFLRKLNDEGRLLKNYEQADAVVCFEYEAVEFEKMGKQLEIVVPQEGTLSYAQGIFSNVQIKVPSDSVLLSAGLRLLDGRCKNTYYPTEEDYKAAVTVDNLEHFLSISKNVHRNIRRGVFNERLYSSADTREHIIFPAVAIVIVLLWMVSIANRTIRRDVQRAVNAIALIIVGWLGLRLFKYQLGYNTVNRYCWYCYYIFQLALPVLMLYLAIIVDMSGQEKKLPCWFMLIACAYPFLIVLVLTNDLHNWVFNFYDGIFRYETYSYSWGYYLIYAYCMLTFLTSLLVMTVKSRKSPRRFAWLLPTVFSIMMIGYTVGYAMGWKPARSSDFAVTFCIMAMIFTESCFRVGILPVNTNYQILFYASPLSIQLLNKDGMQVLASDTANPLPPVLSIQLCSGGISEMELDKDTLICGHSISGGTAVWQVDISELNKLRSELQNVGERLSQVNILLQKEESVRRRKFKIEAESRLASSLKSEIDEQLKRLRNTIESMNESDCQIQTAYITLLICHLKRRCNLFFIAREGMNIKGEELSMYLDELGEFARYAGVNALIYSTVSDSIPILQATACYDFWFELMSWSLWGCKATLLGKLERDNNGLMFSVLTSEEPDEIDFTTGLKNAAEAAGGKISIRVLDGESGIYLLFKGGGSK